jgi:hypothetical protein
MRHRPDRHADLSTLVNDDYSGADDHDDDRRSHDHHDGCGDHYHYRRSNDDDDRGGDHDDTGACCLL